MIVLTDVILFTQRRDGSFLLKCPGTHAFVSCFAWFGALVWLFGQTVFAILHPPLQPSNFIWGANFPVTWLCLAGKNFTTDSAKNPVLRLGDAHARQEAASKEGFVLINKADANIYQLRAMIKTKKEWIDTIT